MSSTGLTQIDHAVQQTNIWLGELMMMLDWTDRAQAYHAVQAVLPLLRNHLPVNEAAHLSAQLPLVIRAIFFEGWQPAKEPIKDRGGEEFLGHVGKAFANTVGAHPGEIATAVFALLARHVTPGEIAQVKASLPEGVRRYWPNDQRPAREIRYQ